MSRSFCVYIMSNFSGTLYTGMTNDLVRRVDEHRSGSTPGFTKKYHVDRLVYYEACDTALDAIAREKQLKNWRREKKLWLIKQMNPEMRDLSDDIREQD